MHTTPISRIRLALCALALFVLGACGPSGNREYTAEWPVGQLTLSYPADWAVMDLYRKTNMFQALVVARSERALQELYGGNISLSTSDTLNLVAPGNVLMTFALISVEPPGLLRSLVEQMAEGTQLVNAQVVDSVTETTLGGHPAYEAHVRGADAGGRTVISRHIGFAAGSLLLRVNVVRPARASEATLAAVEDVLESVRFTAAAPR